MNDITKLLYIEGSSINIIDVRIEGNIKIMEIEKNYNLNFVSSVLKECILKE